MAEQDTYALAYCDIASRKWFYIPTSPEARKWRGPYDNRGQLYDGIQAELGEGCNVTQTTVRPSCLVGATNG